MAVLSANDGVISITSDVITVASANTSKDITVLAAFVGVGFLLLCCKLPFGEVLPWAYLPWLAICLVLEFSLYH